PPSMWSCGRRAGDPLSPRPPAIRSARGSPSWRDGSWGVADAPWRPTAAAATRECASLPPQQVSVLVVDRGDRGLPVLEPTRCAGELGDGLRVACAGAANALVPGVGIVDRTVDHQVDEQLTAIGQVGGDPGDADEIGSASCREKGQVSGVTKARRNRRYVQTLDHL